ncbi:MAG: alpha/beta hydrolase [Geminicoccaceae bacterium]
MADSEIGAIRAALAAKPRPADLAERRARLDAIGRQYPLPADVRVEPVSAGGVRAEWLTTPAASADRAVVFLHGGGYISGSLDSHRHLSAELGRACGARALAVDYRRAPENPFPAAHDDVFAAYRWLLEQGLAPGRIAVVGESAGGGLTVALLAGARAAGLPPPACATCIAPWVDLADSAPSYAEKDAVDPLIHKGYLDELAGLYLQGASVTDPRASPIHADLAGLPPLLIHVGSCETLLDDAVGLARRAGAAGVDVTLRIWPGMIHAFPLWFPQLAEGRAAIAETAAFVRRHMAD